MSIGIQKKRVLVVRLAAGVSCKVSTLLFTLLLNVYIIGGSGYDSYFYVSVGRNDYSVMNRLTSKCFSIL